MMGDASGACRLYLHYYDDRECLSAMYSTITDHSPDLSSTGLPRQFTLRIRSLSRFLFIQGKSEKSDLAMSAITRFL